VRHGEFTLPYDEHTVKGKCEERQLGQWDSLLALWLHFHLRVCLLDVPKQPDGVTRVE